MVKNIIVEELSWTTSLLWAFKYKKSDKKSKKYRKLAKMLCENLAKID